MNDAELDTPTERASINQMRLDQLEQMLAELRERRLERVRKLEAVAQVKADDARLASWLKLERALMVAERYLKKCRDMETRAEQLVHKVRIAAMVVQLEVGDDDGSEGS